MGSDVDRKLRLLGLVIAFASACGTPAASSGDVPTSRETTSPEPTASNVVSAPPSNPTSEPSSASAARIAFTGFRDGQSDVYTIAPDGSALARVTNSQQVEHHVFWLLDGSRLAFAWSEPGEAGDYHASLATVQPDGSDRRELGSVQTAYSEPVLSPDGRYVAFGGDGDQTGKTGIIVLDLRNGTRTQLTTDGEGSPVWSPDGNHILAFAPSRVVVVVEVASGVVIGRIEDPNVAEVLGWLDDGTAILYGACEPRCGALPVTAANPDGSNARRYDGPLPAAPTGVRSPDGAWVAAVIGDSLLVGAIGGTTLTPLIPASWSARGQPSWSADSNQLAFSAATEVAGPIRVYVVERTGGEPVAITPGPRDFSVSW